MKLKWKIILNMYPNSKPMTITEHEEWVMHSFLQVNIYEKQLNCMYKQ